MVEQKFILKKNITPEDLYMAIRKEWDALHIQQMGVKMEELLAQTAILDGMAGDDHNLYLILDSASFEFTFVGQNAEAFSGYKEADYAGGRMKFAFKVLRLSHLGVFLKWMEFTHYAKNMVPLDELLGGVSMTFCGLTFRHKEGHYVKTLVRAHVLASDEDGLAAITLLKLTNVTNLLKSDDYWIRYVFGADRKHKRCYLSAGLGRTLRDDLISERELEILRLIAEGLQTNEIAEQLFISPTTVETHRKNMVARLGARDTVALTEICKKAGIL